MDQLLVQDLHKKSGLPLELIQIILRYTYRQQPKFLLEDVQNYSHSLIEIKDMYYNNWFQIEPGEHLNWLENDIIRYANNDRLTNLGPHFKMLNILSRSLMYKKLVEFPIFNNITMSVNTVINIFWGLFTVAERNKFLEDGLN